MMRKVHAHKKYVILVSVPNWKNGVHAIPYYHIGAMTHDREVNPNSHLNAEILVQIPKGTILFLSEKIEFLIKQRKILNFSHMLSAPGYRNKMFRNYKLLLAYKLLREFSSINSHSNWKSNWNSFYSVKIGWKLGKESNSRLIIVS